MLNQRFFEEWSMNCALVLIADLLGSAVIKLPCDGFKARIGHITDSTLCSEASLNGLHDLSSSVGVFIPEVMLKMLIADRHRSRRQSLIHIMAPAFDHWTGHFKLGVIERWR